MTQECSICHKYFDCKDIKRVEKNHKGRIRSPNGMISTFWYWNVVDSCPDCLDEANEIVDDNQLWDVKVVNERR